jgi:hypothetical protein
MPAEAEGLRVSKRRKTVAASSPSEKKNVVDLTAVSPPVTDGAAAGAAASGAAGAGAGASGSRAAAAAIERSKGGGVLGERAMPPFTNSAPRGRAEQVDPGLTALGFNACTSSYHTMNSFQTLLSPQVCAATKRGVGGRGCSHFAIASSCQPRSCGWCVREREREREWERRERERERRRERQRERER